MFAIDDIMVSAFMHDVEPGLELMLFDSPWADEDGFTTTFGMDFSIADRFGADAVRDTFDRAFEGWKDDYRYLTDLVQNLNWKIWEHYEKKNMVLSRLYDELWSKADEYACTHLQGDELAYFYRKTD